LAFSNNVQKGKFLYQAKQLDLPHCQPVGKLAVCRFKKTKDTKDIAYPAVLLQTKATLQCSPSPYMPCVK